MHKGDIVIADHPDSRSNRFIRSYGIVQEVTKAGNVIIKLADGSLIKQQYNSIAVYIQPPSNWQDLYQQQVVFSPPKQQTIFRNSHDKQRHN
ncbi:MAG: hypothetical protein HKP41_03575 [Desulfobacterales bacterium]|nr:hypothetical protein [Desulfobacterales bacterium]